MLHDLQPTRVALLHHPSSPALARPPLVAGHMAPATVQAGMVHLSPLPSFLFLPRAVVVGVVLARGAVPELVCRVLLVPRVRDSVRAESSLGVGRVRRKAGHRPSVGRGRGERNPVRVSTHTLLV